MTVKWNTSQESNQTLKLPFLGGHCLQISRTILALSLYVTVSLAQSLSLPLRHSACSNEWQSGDVVLIYCMVAQMEPGWNLSVIGVSLRWKHLWCLGTTNRSIRNGFPTEPSAYPRCTHTSLHRYTIACARTENKICTLYWQSYTVFTVNKLLIYYLFIFTLRSSPTFSELCSQHEPKCFSCPNLTTTGCI